MQFTVNGYIVRGGKASGVVYNIPFFVNALNILKFWCSFVVSDFQSEVQCLNKTNRWHYDSLSNIWDTLKMVLQPSITTRSERHNKTTVPFQNCKLADSYENTARDAWFSVTYIISMTLFLLFRTYISVSDSKFGIGTIWIGIPLMSVTLYLGGRFWMLTFLIHWSEKTLRANHKQ